MRNISYLLAVIATLALGSNLMAQSNESVNYTITRTYTEASEANYIEDVTVYNGLGDKSRIVNKDILPNTNIAMDLVTPIYYDKMKRESRAYLPYSVNSNTDYADAEIFDHQADFYDQLYGDQANGYTYTENIYDNSPLNRVTQAYNVGAVYRNNNKKSTTSYGVNVANEVVRLEVSKIGSEQSLLRLNYYAPNTLNKNTVTNEDGTTTSTYTDVLGRVVMERTIGDNNTSHDTYYVYDDIGNLCYVLPPKLSDIVKSSSSNSVILETYELAYIYKYDINNRCIEKKLPGANPVYMVYDKGDRLVMTQDGNQRNRNVWIHSIYDDFDRLVSQSIVRGGSNISLSTLRTQMDAPNATLPSSFSIVVLLSETKYGE